MVQTAMQKVYEKRYMQTEKGKAANQRKCAKYRKTESYRKAQAKYRANRYSSGIANRKRAARGMAFYAIANGTLIRPDHCEECGHPCKAYAHHDDYHEPLQIRWLCQACDRAAHSKTA